MRGGVRCLKSSAHDDGVVLEVPIGVIDDQGRTTKKCSISDLVPTLRSQSHGNEAKAVLEVEVKEATKQGYAIARGGGMPSTSRCREAKQEEDESG